jgi:hypothetical protein
MEAEDGDEEKEEIGPQDGDRYGRHEDDEHCDREHPPRLDVGRDADDASPRDRPYRSSPGGS